MLTEENKNLEDIIDSNENAMEEMNPLAEAEPQAQDTDLQLAKELAEQKDKFLRLFAEFDNFKKRTAKERIELIKTAGQEIIQEMIGVLDDFDRAQKISTDNNNQEAYPEGMALVHHKLITILTHRGLKSMNSTGEPFNPEYHEAIAEIPATSDDLKGKVIDTVEKGYLLSDKIIRFAKVVVGK